MRRIAFAILSSIVFVGFVCFVCLGGLMNAANAGGYYPQGYGGQAWYGTNCCSRKIVRYERSVINVPAGIYGHEDGYVEPHRVVRTFAPPSPLLYDSAYHFAYVIDGFSCYRRLVTLDNRRGGWLWGVEESCY